VPTFRSVLTVLATVVSRKGPTAVLNCGHKVIAGGPASVSPVGAFREVHEQHMLLDVDEAEPSPSVGDVLEVTVGYSGGTINLHDYYFVASGEEIVDVWKIAARGPGWTSGADGAAHRR
jgi:D-serine deaminase-like pyridoxal phosphate-dependent protein